MKNNKYEGASIGQLKLELAITIIIAVIVAVMIAVSIVMMIRQQQNFDRVCEVLEKGNPTLSIAFRNISRF